MWFTPHQNDGQNSITSGELASRGDKVGEQLIKLLPIAWWMHRPGALARASSGLML
jgi:hypothetical protein